MKPWDKPESVTIDIVVRGKYTDGVEVQYQISIDDSPTSWEVGIDREQSLGETPDDDDSVTVKLEASAPARLVRQRTLTTGP